MPAAPDASGPAGLILAAFVGMAAAFLGWRQWRDHRSRPLHLSPMDESHFDRQDLRRLLGTIVLSILAVALALGGMMPARLNGRPNLKFVQLWSGVALLIVVLLILALMDWISTHLYARRHRDRVVRQGLDLIEAELRSRMAGQAGPVDDDEPEDDPS